MHLRGVLVEPRRELVLGFLHRHAVDMVDLLARRSAKRCGEPARTLSQACPLIGGQADPGPRGLDAFWQGWNMRLRRCRHLVALAHHHPSDIVEHRLAMLVRTGWSASATRSAVAASTPSLSPPARRASAGYGSACPLRSSAVRTRRSASLRCLCTAGRPTEWAPQLRAVSTRTPRVHFNQFSENRAASA